MEPAGPAEASLARARAIPGDGARERRWRAPFLVAFYAGACQNVAIVFSFLGVALCAFGVLLGGPSSLTFVVVLPVGATCWLVGTTLVTHVCHRSRSIFVEVVCTLASTLAPLLVAAFAANVASVVGVRIPWELPFLLVPAPVAALLTLCGGTLAAVWIWRRGLPLLPSSEDV